MTKRQAKIEALRVATALVNGGIVWDDSRSDADIAKIEGAMQDIAVELYRRAVKLGGEFNRYTGYVDSKGGDAK